jgi:hypothetical protein
MEIILLRIGIVILAVLLLVVINIARSNDKKIAYLVGYREGVKKEKYIPHYHSSNHGKVICEQYFRQGMNDGFNDMEDRIRSIDDPCLNFRIDNRNPDPDCMGDGHYRCGECAYFFAVKEIAKKRK